MNVISVLQAIAADPVTMDGQEVAPVAWDCNCLEEVCGACSMVINERVMQACSALVDDLLKEGSTICLKPMTKFPDHA
jgi:succinate dehydrogenase / fumarate reductase iron-sulfur subunit